MHYSITPYNPAAHLFKVICTIPAPNREGQIISLPVWIPGSYMIREFGKNIVTIKARSDGDEISLTKLDKASWQAEPCNGPLEIEYEVYAWDLSVRSAHLDTTHAYFNGTSVFLKVHGKEREPVTVDICPPPGELGRNWRVATSMSCAGAKVWQFGRYGAQNYEELIDHPVEIADFSLASFEVDGTPHHVVVAGRHKADMERLCTDLKAICEAQSAFYNGLPSMERYLFLFWVVGDGYGGLEHRASCSLMCSRGDLPYQAMVESTDGYRSLLGLCSHEYFHTWNIKRIKPVSFMPYDLSKETYTRQLWAFEGITSYYDDLMLLRSGRISADDYLTLLAQTATRVWSGEGRFKQSVADSSYDAWTKFYRQDENAPNAIVSYYTKGSLIALALDITIRKLSNDRKSLDDVMYRLWNEYGKPAVGVPEGEIERIVTETAGQPLGSFFADYLYGTKDLPLKNLLKYLGIEFTLRQPLSDDDKGGPVSPQENKKRPDMGMRTVPDSLGTKVANVYAGGAAELAGIAAGDVIVAFEGLKVTTDNLGRFIERSAIGEVVQIHLFRRDELMVCDVCLQCAPHNRAVLSLVSDIDAITQKRRDHWMNSMGQNDFI